MGLDLVDYEKKANEAVMSFWGNRETARQKQIELGKIDQGERSGVTAGKNMDGFGLFCQKLVNEQLYTSAAVITSQRDAIITGAYSELSTISSLKTFITSFAGHIAAEAARLG